MNDELVDNRIAKDVLNGLKGFASSGVNLEPNGDLKVRNRPMIQKPLL